MNPREFLDEYVAPAIYDSQKAGHENIRLATTAICELDNLAEHMILYLNPGTDRPGISRERERRAAAVPATGLARDLHDTHKHGPLARKSARITQGQRPETRYIGGAIGSGPIGAAPIGGSIVELWIVADDGTHHLPSAVISECYGYWRTELARHGM
jgi:hypothetical protein